MTFVPWGTRFASLISPAGCRASYLPRMACRVARIPGAKDWRRDSEQPVGSTVAAQKGGALLMSHVSRQHGRICPGQVDHDQPVQNVGKGGVDIEAQQLATHLQVLAKQYRHSLAVAFQLFKKTGNLGRILNQCQGLAAVALQAAEWPPGSHMPCKLWQIAVGVQEIDQQLA